MFDYWHLYSQEILAMKDFQGSEYIIYWAVEDFDGTDSVEVMGI